MSENKPLSDRFKSYVYSTHPVMLSASELFRYADEIAALEQRLDLSKSDADVMKANWHAACNQLDDVEKRLAEAHYFVQTYANKHPLHEHNGVIQDPAGAHDWLKWYAENSHD